MGNTKLKCKSCGNEFIGDEYTFSCPSCGGDSLVIIEAQTFGERLKDLLYKNRIVAGVFGVLVLGFLLLPKDNVNIEQPINVLTFKKEKDYLGIIITRYSQDLTETKVLDFDENKLYYSECGFEAFIESEQLKIKDGKIYPCSNGMITIKWKNTNLFKNQSMPYNAPTETFPAFELPTTGASGYAGCRESLKIKVTKNENCQITVETNYDTLYPSLTVWISVDGKKGPYKHQKDWPFDKNHNRFDIWGYEEISKDTVYPNTDRIGFASGCNPMNNEDIKMAATALGNSPSDFHLAMRLKDALDSRGTFYINGNKFTDFSLVPGQLYMDFISHSAPFVTNCAFSTDGESVKVYFTNKE
jgi:hypothetical protein